ncbi:uncharacterized protein with ParB-like and HNH nuclease domain [Planococcus citreus]|uniref:Uncharacterized protein with ParB-like and HNH nuclease domain n=2 Tax=Planococcus citreus TaxID=1373 RepID=A0A497YJG9_9BACL|nr:uncharacterized protein with ParB-like and HNH nuclease domain [Planococcus citreus]
MLLKLKLKVTVNINMISSEIKDITSVFNNNTTYEIPDFQRDFVWGEDEVRQLFRDFHEDTDRFQIDIKESDGYLLGNIVLIEDKEHPNKKIVIDGQQRLTTLSLLYKAMEALLFDKMKNSTGEDQTKWAMRGSDFKKGYGIINEEFAIEALKIQHHPSLKFGSSYRSIVNGENSSEQEAESPSDKKINEVYEIIEEEIVGLNEIQLSKFVSYIKTKVMLIVTTAPNLSKAFQLFEILNNRGKDLEPLDLIKNLLLKSLTASNYSELDRELFNENWKQFTINLEITPKRKIESSTFLKHYLIGTIGKNEGKDKLFKHFLELKLNSKEVIDLVKDFRRVSKIYGDIERKAYDSFIDDSLKMYILFELLKLRQAHTMLIPFYAESNETKEIVVDLAIRLSSSVIFSYTQTNYIEAEIPALVKEYYKNKKNKGNEFALQTFIDRLEIKITEKAKLAREAISTRKFENNKGDYNKKGIDLLKFIELYGQGNILIKSPAPNKRLTLEHILPRTLRDEEVRMAGFQNTGEFKEFINRIGNLAIVYNTDNSHLSNKNFSQKKTVFADTDFLTTKSLAGDLTTHIKDGKDSKLVNQINENIAVYTSEDSSIYWTKELIDERSAKIASYLEKILTKEVK